MKESIKNKLEKEYQANWRAEIQSRVFKGATWRSKMFYVQIGDDKEKPLN
jgi:hypothetical protein